MKTLEALLTDEQIQELLLFFFLPFLTLSFLPFYGEEIRLSLLFLPAGQVLCHESVSLALLLKRFFEMVFPAIKRTSSVLGRGEERMLRVGL